MKSLSLCVTTFIAGLTNLIVLQTQSLDLQLLCKQKIPGTSTALVAETHRSMCMNLHNFPTFDIILDSLTLHAPETRDLVELILIYFHCMDAYLLQFC